MIRAYHKILFYILMLFIGINISCERVEPDDYAGSGEELNSVLNPGVKLLDQDSYNYLGILDGKLIFEILGGADVPSIGTIFIYFDQDDRVFGRIESIAEEGGVLSIVSSSVCLNEVFDFMALKLLFNELEADSTYMDPRISLASDTMVLEPIEKLWDLGDGNWGLMNLDTLRIINKTDGEAQYFIGPAWKEGVVTQRIDNRLEQEFDLQANIRIFSKGSYSVTDSLLVRERKLGPVSSGGFPVDYIIQEWLRISIVSEGDNSFTAGFTSSGNSESTAKYLQGKSWELSSDMVEANDVINEIIWDNRNAVDISICLENRFIPVFCGYSDIKVSSINTWSFDSDVQWPDWQYTVNREYGLKLESGNSIFCDIPDGEFAGNEISTQISEGSGQLENNAPVPDFTVSPSSGYTDTEFLFNAEKSSDFEDDSEDLEVRWDFNGDEIWDTNYSTLKRITRYFTTPGRYTVVLEVKDSQGLTDLLPKIVVVEAESSAPIASFTVTPESGRVSDRFIFDASGSWDSGDDASELLVRWDFEGDDVWDTQFSTEKIAWWYYEEPGTYYAKLEVKDTDGLSDSKNKKIEVDAINTKPTAVFTVSPEEGDINTFFHFDASESYDIEDDASLLRVRWDFENDGEWDTDYRTIKTINHQFQIANTYTVLLEVTDTEGYYTLFSKDVVVSNLNTKPIADFTISPTTGDTTTVFTFDARITVDLEDSIEELEFRWDWDNDGTYETEFAPAAVMQRTFETAGTKLIKMEVRDSGGLTDTKTRLLTID